MTMNLKQFFQLYFCNFMSLQNLVRSKISPTLFSDLCLNDYDYVGMIRQKFTVPVSIVFNSKIFLLLGIMTSLDLTHYFGISYEAIFAKGTTAPRCGFEHGLIISLSAVMSVNVNIQR